MLNGKETKQKINLNELSSLIRHRAWIEVDLQALEHNVKAIKTLLAPPTELMAVVKADAYGHGAVKIAETVITAGCSSLAIATIQEGIELREAGITVPILLLGAINTPAEIKTSVHWHLEPTIVNYQQALVFIETLTQAHLSLPVHIKLDTGMSRLGTPWQQGKKLIQLVQQSSCLQISSIYSHLATADDPDSTTMELQQQKFEKAIAFESGLRPIAPLPQSNSSHWRFHLANSAATLCDRRYHYDLVRVGLALYGLYPAPHLQTKVKLKPILQVKARITQVKTITAGTGVSYSHKFIAPHDLPIAVVGIGYADGVPRLLSNRLQVLIRGQLIPQIGNITMDQIMLDVSSIPDVQPGEIVTLIGKDQQQEISVDNWANTLGTISWEVLCGFKHRLPRIYK